MKSWLLFALLLPASLPAAEVLPFGVINQRSISLTARFWNPILAYVNRHAQVDLRLSMGRTAPETTAMTVRGRHALVYTNHLFTTERDRLGFRVILRIAGPDIRSVIIVPASSPIRSLAQLSGRKVVFPSREAFVGYWVPMDHLRRSGIRVQAVYAGNQEGAMAQLRHGRVVAAAVNQRVLAGFAHRTGFRYRVIWRSQPYRNIPIMVSPRVDPGTVERIRRVFVNMTANPDGRRILAASAALIGRKRPLRFVRATDAEYDNYRRFYRNTVLRH